LLNFTISNEKVSIRIRSKSFSDGVVGSCFFNISKYFLFLINAKTLNTQIKERKAIKKPRKENLSKIINDTKNNITTMQLNAIRNL
jgi:hypothetical protein